MSWNAHLVSVALWCAHPVLQAAVAATMLWRKLHRTFPVFFSYVVFQIAAFALTFPFRDERFYVLFFYAAWATTGISVVLGFKVIHEVFVDVFRPYHALRDLGTVLFKWAGLVMLMVAGVMAISAGPNRTDPLVSGIVTLERSVRVAQCGLVLFLLVFSRYLGTSWRQNSFGIALGFGSFAAVELSLVAFSWRGSGVINPDLTSRLNMIAYNVTILIWFGYMLVKSPAREHESYMLRPQRWEQGLGEIQHPAVGDSSLIPMFESMVDRALSRTNADPVPPALEQVADLKRPLQRTDLPYPRTSPRIASKS
jgi:energy-converting hydrogenase Eha subunit E